MAGTKISALPAASSVAAADLVPIVSGGVNYSATAEVVAEYVVSAGLPFVVLLPSGDTTGVADAVAMNAASVTGRSIRLDAGTFYVNADILLQSDQHWQGAGKDLTTVFAVSGSDPVAVFDQPAGNKSNVTISDLTIDVNKAGNATGIGIRYSVFADSTVARCRIQNAETYGIQSATGTNVTIVDCDIIDNGGTNTQDGTHCAILSTTVGNRIIGNRITNCSDSSIIVAADGENVIANNVVNGSNFIGIGLGAGHAATGGPHTITGNVVKDCVGNGIDTGTACNVTVAGNSIYDVFAGIDIDLSSVARSICNVAVTGNSVKLCGSSGIELIGNQTNGHSGFTVVGNTVADVQLHGIHISAMQDGTISDNVVADVSRSTPGFGFLRFVAATPGCTDIQVIGNEFNNDLAINNAYAISSSGATNNYLTIIGNNMRNTWGKIVGALGTGCIVRFNIGATNDDGWTLHQEFTTAGSTGGITLPADAKEAKLVVVSGGAGGGSGRRGAAGSVRCGGGGGGGGIALVRTLMGAVLTETFTAVVGAGGAGGAAVTANDTNGNAGTAGAASSVSGATTGLLVQAYIPSAGGGGTAAAGAAGGVVSGEDIGGGGGAASGTGGAGAIGTTISKGATGGGAGGGITSGDTPNAGGNGGFATASNTFAAGGAIDTAGAAGAAVAARKYQNGLAAGIGGGGGGGSIVGVAGTGGAGSSPGGGGGGGGASLNGNNSGAGGAGAVGYVGIWVLR